MSEETDSQKEEGAVDDGVIEAGTGNEEVIDAGAGDDGAIDAGAGDENVLDDGAGGESAAGAEAGDPDESGDDMQDAMARAMAEERAQASGQPEEAFKPSESLMSKISNDMNLDTLLKVPVSLSIEVGRTRMPLSELLETQEGSVIELERLLDEPLDILVNGALIAHGVVVLANDRFGIQITDIVSPQERVRTL